MGKRILIADDDPDILMMLSLRLRKAGFEVAQAKEGGTVIAEVKRFKPDLVILDYFLPGLKGDAISRAIKEDPETKNVPIVLLSASTAALSRETISAIPADEKITKPFDVAQLLSAIERLLSS